MSISMNLFYTGTNGSAREFVREMEESGTAGKIRAEEGNLGYTYYFSDQDPETVLLVDRWENQQALDRHHASQMMQTILQLRDKYHLTVSAQRYLSDEGGIPASDQKFLDPGAQPSSAQTSSGNGTGRKETAAPNIDSQLRHILRMPQAVYRSTGIIINGRRIKSFVFTTDIAIIRNCDADAVFAVYPFTPQQAVSDSIIKGSYIPVFAGVGGGTTKGLRTISLAKDAESQGAMGVVMNSPISNANLLAVARAVYIPVIITVTREDTDIGARIRSGASILNVACAEKTPALVRRIREEFPEVPIIASGGKTNETIAATIAAGANAVTYTPPSTAELFRSMMDRYREA